MTCKKKLIEVALPLEAINVASAREKSIRHRNPGRHPRCQQDCRRGIAHLAGLMGASVTVTIEIEAQIPEGAPDNVVRTVTENSRTLKFTSQGFEKE